MKAFKNLLKLSRAYEVANTNTHSLLAFSGVYRRNENIEVFIDITRVQALRTHTIGKDVTLGGNMSLTETMEVFKKASKRSGFQYLTYLIDHIDLIANVPVRNVSSRPTLSFDFTRQNIFP